MSLERLLYGTTLADKLSSPTGSSSLPSFPGRPHGLARGDGHRRLPTLKASAVESDPGRRRILHELLNHELQAIELLALALARWPDAPLAQGWRSTLEDEQKHLELYLGRLQSLGGDLGEVPVSTSFWDTLRDADLSGFIAGLSLTYEAANLDFARTWRDRFRAAGDTETATVLQTVLDDEIRHVSLGLAWFREGHDDVLQAWQGALPSPLTPAHARGADFHEEARRRAGFRPHEIAQLRILGGHRSQHPRVLGFDATLEDRIAGRTPSRHTLAVNQALAHVPLFLARPSDVVRSATPACALDLANAGFALPRFDAAAEVDTPWGIGPEHADWDPAYKLLSDKCATLETLNAQDRHPLWVENLGQIWTIPAETDGSWVLKAPYSASGTQRIRGEGPLSEPHRRWLDKQLRTYGRVLYQPWYPALADVSVHVTVGDSVSIDGVTRFATRNGVFLGGWPGIWTRSLGEHQRWLHGNGDPDRAVEPVLRASALAAGTWAQTLGYRGPLSIDALVVQTAKGLRVQPWLETNARNTLGRVLLAMRKRIHPPSSAFWHLGETDAASKVELDGGRIRAGVLRTGGGWLKVSRGALSSE